MLKTQRIPEARNRAADMIIHLFNRHIRGGQIILRFCMYFFMFIIGFVFVFPFLYMIITSIKSPYDLYDTTVNWIPRSFYLSNYSNALEELEYVSHFLISVCLTLAGIVCHCIIDSFIAYGLARYRFPGKGILFFMVILSIVIPTQVIILPQYLEFAMIKWTNTYLPMIVPLFFGMGLRSGVFIFLFRQFFIGLPKSLEEAAKIDGCGYIKVFWRIALPTAKSALLVCIVLALVWHWNEYYAPAIYLNSADTWPLPSMLPRIYELYQIQSGQSGGFGNINQMNIRDASKLISEGTVMAATFLVILPVLASYTFLQKKFMEGIERTGLVE